MTQGRRSITLRNAINLASEKLGNRLEAQLLLAFSLRRDRSWLYAHQDDLCPADDFDRFLRLVSRRQSGEPFAYLTGEREFYSRSFQVNPDVLIPRPETELLVEHALSLDLPERAWVLDIGTGSGCIAITLCLERPGWNIVAGDTSHAALEVTEANCEALGAGNLELFEGNLFDAVEERRFDLIVSNPPYIAAGDKHLGEGDVRFEPEVALIAGADGLDLIRAITAHSPEHLNPGGWLLLEHGHDQAADVRTKLEANGFSQIGSRCDLAGIERISFGKKP